MTRIGIEYTIHIIIYTTLKDNNKKLKKVILI